jgi:hypothetical protein
VAGKPAIKVEGARELRKALGRMEDGLSDLTALHREIAERVASDARERAPSLSGKLRGSIKGKGYKTRAAVTAGSKLVPYAGPIHFGWPARNIKPQPFLYDALDHRKGEIVNAYEERVGELVKRLDRETPG